MKSPRAIRNAAIAYVVWAEATKAEWNITLHDLADRAAQYFNDGSITVDVIRGICGKRKSGGKKWLDLVRVTSPTTLPDFA